ncbi:MAG TPA: tape measure protein, partial [Flavipsychrobacter sp.]|nr:tape measure protein [Flavipsychrobacter sp.]
GLKTFLGEQGANKAFANIKKDAAATPYSIDSLLGVNRALISAGVSADKARQDTMNLANAIAAVGGGNDELSRMAANMQQIRTVGKATQMDIRQFANTGINIYKLLSDATGKTVAQIEEMEVSYDTLAFALSKAARAGGMYAGALEAQSKTIAGKWSTLTDNIAEKAVEMATSLKPFISKVLDMSLAFTSASTNVMTKLEPIMPLIKDLAHIAGNVLSPALRIVSSVVRFVANEFFEFLKLLKPVIHFVSRLSDYVGLALNAVANAVAAKTKSIAEIIKDGVSGESMVAFFKKAGEIHGQKYIDGLLQQYQRVALFMDKFYKTTAYGQKFNDIATQIKGTSAADTVITGRAPRSSSSPLAGLGSGKNINGGGARNITINLGKFFDSFNIHTQTVNEGVDRLEEKVAEAMLRVLNSGNAIQGN